MKEKLRKLSKSPILVLFILLVVCFALPALNLDPESTRFAIVSTMGVDKTGDEIEVSMLILAPKSSQSVTEKYILMSAKDKTLSSAIDKIGLHLGKEIVLGHMYLIVVSDSMTQENLAPMLDYLVRSYNLGNRTLLMNCDGKAKDLIEEGQKLDESTGLKLNDLVYYNERYVNAVISNLEDFYRGILNPTNASLVSFITISEEETEGVPTGSSSENSSSESESGQGEGEKQEGESNKGEKKKKVISNRGGASLFKNGKKIMKLSPEQVEGLNWVSRVINNGYITIDEVNTDELKDASITFSHINKGLRHRVVFENGKPIIVFEPSFVLVLEEINEDVEGYKIVESQTFALTPEIEKKIEDKIKKEFAESLQILKENKCDVLNVYKKLDAFSHKQFQEFLNGLENKDDFLKYVTCLLEVELYLKV